MFVHGIDLVNITRSEFMYPTLYTKILHANECKLYKHLQDYEKPLFLAKYWAIKEALFKALPKKIALTEIEIIKKEQEYIYFHDSYLFKISISFADQYVIASVIGFKKSS